MIDTLDGVAGRCSPQVAPGADIVDPNTGRAGRPQRQASLHLSQRRRLRARFPAAACRRLLWRARHHRRLWQLVGLACRSPAQSSSVWPAAYQRPRPVYFGWCASARISGRRRRPSAKRQGGGGGWPVGAGWPLPCRFRYPLPDFGEDAISPTVPPASPGRHTGQRRAAHPHRAEVRRRLRRCRRTNAPCSTSEPGADCRHVGEQDSHKRQQAVYQRSVKKAQDDGARQLAEENAHARADQVASREAAKADVRMGSESHGARRTARSRSSSGTSRVRNGGTSISRSARRSMPRIAMQMPRSMKQRRRPSLRRARPKPKRRPRRKRKRAGRAVGGTAPCGAVSYAFDAIRGAITAIFDTLRAVVKGIIDTAKKAVHALIEAARSAIVAMIQAFGAFVKGLLTIALAAFPNAAAKARAWIDNRVKSATNAVNRAAAALEHAAQAILDGIAQGIDAALDILQAGLLTAIDVIENVALLPFKIASGLETLWEILKILKSGALARGSSPPSRIPRSWPSPLSTRSNHWLVRCPSRLNN